MVQKRDGEKWRIHYEGFPASMDETVGLDRLRDMSGQPIAANGGGTTSQPLASDGPANGIQDPGSPVPRSLPQPAPPAAADAIDWI
jgi:hypothetical protein